jgi:hypothetical protein
MGFSYRTTNRSCNGIFIKAKFNLGFMGIVGTIDLTFAYAD